jgi:pSer/pThr/pTyr-binding forkhead associated (FHA) protein
VAPTGGVRSDRDKLGGKVFLNMEAALHVLSGHNVGQTIRVPRKLLIGRETDCDLRLGSEFVSSYHCVLLLEEDALWIRDLGSKNGTFVSGRRIGTNVTNLLNGDAITIGDVHFLVDLIQVTPGTQPADPETASQVTQEALAGTGFFEGDTVQADGPAVTPPLPSVPPPAPLPHVSKASSTPSDQIGPVRRQEHS